MNIHHSVEIPNVPEHKVQALCDFLTDNGITEFEVWSPDDAIDIIKDNE